MKLTEEEINEMCTTITTNNLHGDELVNYVSEFLVECEKQKSCYCQCDAGCGNWFEDVIPGTKCTECHKGTMQPQDVEPWED